MIRIGLVGLGAMGRGHLEQYIRLMKEDDGIKLVAICDIDPARFEATTGNLNIEGVGKSAIDLSVFHLYNSYDQMLADEALDMVDLVIPTYIHAEYTAKALALGLHVFCEKPMALTPEQCDRMIKARDDSGKYLMIGQCLRFWPAYEELKKIIDGDTLGKPTAGYYARFGGTPQGSYENWYLDETRSGGCLLDQHIHDVDMISHLFGLPEAVSTRGINVNPGAGIDALTTMYRYPSMSITSEDDWSLNGKDMRFRMTFRQNFTGGAVVFENDTLTVYPNGEASYQPELVSDNGYYRELRYFLDCIRYNVAPTVSNPESTRDTIILATAEKFSVKSDGMWTKVR